MSARELRARRIAERASQNPFSWTKPAAGPGEVAEPTFADQVENLVALGSGCGAGGRVASLVGAKPWRPRPGREEDGGQVERERTPVIILFDTNAINQVDLRNPRTDIVRALRRSGQRVGVPGMVLEELVAHKTKEYMAQQQGAASALKALRRKMPWQPAAAFEEPRLELEECQAYWRRAYSELFEVVATSGEAALKALAREALALPPAKRDAEPPEGARDAAIWFTILDYLQQHPDDEVHFVTNNTKDFGNGITYRFPMDQDLGNCASRLKRLKDFNAVVTTFTEPVDGAYAATEAERHLGSEAVAAEIGKLALTHRTVVGFPGINSAGEAVEWKGWIGLPSATLLSAGTVAGHRIGEQVWYTAEPTWLLFGTAGTAGGGMENISCAWRIKLLFPVGEKGDGEEPTLLWADDPFAPDMRDEPTATAVEALRKKVIAEIITTRKPVGKAGSSDTAEVQARLRQVLGENLSIRLFPTAESLASQLIPGLDAFADALRASVDTTPLADAIKASLVPSMSPVIDAMKTSWLHTYDFTSILDMTRPRIDIASTLPDYSITLPIAADPYDWQHEEDTDASEDESDGGGEDGEDAAEDES
ncbi:PIN domain-containing protein [Kitasatospora purpeofusca]|uniref:PIN domain-containing protein n=1 Tax=Kitasatospora purpeofusca TaxID=67352 RepID=UPI0035D73834